MREINEKSEKEKQEQEERRKQEQARKQEQEKEKEERRKKLINYDLGEIIYMARNGGLFQAHHSIHLVVSRRSNDTHPNSGGGQRPSLSHE
jgi:hypothetical protein